MAIARRRASAADKGAALAFALLAGARLRCAAFEGVGGVRPRRGDGSGGGAERIPREVLRGDGLRRAGRSRGRTARVVLLLA
eukprot:4918458-Alexandrium_andersonii.AAC.1